MKKTLTLLIVFSFVFPGTVYLGIDGTTPEAEFSANGISDTGDLDGGGVTIGYNHPVYQKEKMGIAIGGSYNLVGMDMDDEEAGFLSIYALPTYSFNEKMMGWFSLGLNMPTHDVDEGDSGLTYGLGVHYKMNDKMGFGAGYVSNATAFDGVDITVSRISLFLGYSL
tara:strand:+ start:728 stop:1228 length:501 start_codon:yes stop_codon:yes gene_type:complete